MPLGASIFEDVPSVKFLYLVFTRTPGEVTIDNLGLCSCVPCLSSVITSCSLLNHNYSLQIYTEMGIAW